MVDEGTQDSSLDFYAELVTLRAYKKYIQKCNRCVFLQFNSSRMEKKFQLFMNYSDFLSVSV